MTQPIRLNIGAGESNLPGFTPIDAKLGHDATVLEYPDESVDEVYASHVLEHLDRGDSEKALKEWWRVLKPGGRMRIAVPDFVRVIYERDKDPLWEHRLMGGNTDVLDFHKTAWDGKKLRLFLKKLGCERIGPWTAEYHDSSIEPISLRLEGYKPDPSRPYVPQNVRLNIGAGNTVIPGFTPIDMMFGDDASALDYPDNSVEEVYSSHCLEHIHHSKTAATVMEWVRVLKPGGRIRICIPDFEAIDRLRRSDPESFSAADYSAWLHGTDDKDNDRHLAWISRDQLVSILRAAGIEDIAEFKGEHDDFSTRAKFPLNIEGYKRRVIIPNRPTVTMVLSTPRFGPVDTFKSIADTCQKIGWKFHHWGGTEWGKGLEQVTQFVIQRDNPDYIFCLDYDSVFDPEDCLKILEFMQSRPDVAAVWPAEAHRHQDLPLGLAPGGAAAGVYDFSGEFTEMWSGHFGCTMIRAQVFKTLPHPWFWSLPDPRTGDWSNGSDADITFWRSCFNFGFKIGQINTVEIGHLEWCVKWLTPNGILWQPIQHYRAKGKPTAANFDGKFWVQRAKDMEAAKKAGTTPPSVRVPPKVEEIPVHETPPAPIHPPRTQSSPELEIQNGPLSGVLVSGNH